MTPDAFAAACAAVGLDTTAEKAAFFEVNRRAVQMWLKGERAVPGPARAALRCMARLRELGFAPQDSAAD